MPDITMCEGTDCPIKKRCYRYKATPFELSQSYFTNVPGTWETKTNFVCEMYWGKSAQGVYEYFKGVLK